MTPHPESYYRIRQYQHSLADPHKAQTSIQFLIFEEEEAGKNLDGIGALLVDVIARVTNRCDLHFTDDCGSYSGAFPVFSQL